MSIQLIPGFTGKIEVKNSKGMCIYENTCSTSQEVEEFIKTHAQSKPGWSMLMGATCPLRTNNTKDFTKDFFLPTFVNFALKINNAALRVFASIFAVTFDIITFPVRLITTPIRAIYNHRNPEEKHSLSSLIEGKNDGTFNKEDVVTIHYQVEDVQIGEATEEEGHTFRNAKKFSTAGTMRVALKRLPGGIKSQVTGQTESSTYLGMDGEWTLEGYSKGNSKYSSFAC